MIRIQNNLERKVDKLETRMLHVKESIDIGLLDSKDEIEKEIYNLIGDKAAWFEASPDLTIKSIRVGGTEDAKSDPEKARYIQWFNDNYGDQISDIASDIVKRNIMKYYRGGA